MFIATGEKARMSRLATIFAVVAWYFLKRSVANCASTAAGLSQTSNSKTWFGSFCEIAILNWRQPSSCTTAAPSSLIAVMNLSITLADLACNRHIAAHHARELAGDGAEGVLMCACTISCGR